jgi:hypothetical protein
VPAFEPQALSFRAANALLLAQASQAAYMDEAGATRTFPPPTTPAFLKISDQGPHLHPLLNLYWTTQPDGPSDQ